MARICILFQAKTAQKPYPWRHTYPYSLYRGLPPGCDRTCRFHFQAQSLATFYNMMLDQTFYQGCERENFTSFFLALSGTVWLKSLLVCQDPSFQSNTFSALAEIKQNQSFPLLPFPVSFCFVFRIFYQRLCAHL